MKVETIEQAMEAFHVTREQLAKCQAVLDGPSQKWYYIVDSQNTPGVQYCVAYNRQYKALQCLPWNGGPVCKAADAGFGCWHKRVAAAMHVLFRNEQRRIQDAERAQALAERSPEEIASERARDVRMMERWAKLREFRLMR